MAKFKEATKEAVASAVLGVADTPLIKLAHILAKRVDKDSWMQSDEFGTIFGIAKGGIEGFAKLLGPIGGSIIEKLTDFGDFFAAELGHGPSKKESTKDEKERTQRVFDIWSDGYRKSMVQRLGKAKDVEQTKVIMEQLKLEAAFADEFQKLLETTGLVEEKKEEKKKERKAGEDTKSFSAWFQELSEKLGAIYTDWTTITPEEEVKWNGRTNRLNESRKKQEWVRDPWGRKKYGKPGIFRRIGKKISEKIERSFETEEERLARYEQELSERSGGV